MLKNYRSEMPINRIFDNITKMLVSHGARSISFDYGDSGEAVGLSFAIQGPRGMLGIKLPARIDKVARVMEEQRAEGWRSPEQIYRTAWKNIHDWIDAQMALLETEMVKLEEVFLPYVLNRDGRTFFETIEEKGYLLSEGAEGVAAH